MLWSAVSNNYEAFVSWMLKMASCSMIVGLELNRECLELFLVHMAMLGSHLCYQLLVSSQAADGYLVAFREVQYSQLALESCVCFRGGPCEFPEQGMEAKS